MATEPREKRTWRQVAAVVDGKRIPVGPGALLTVDEQGYTITVNGKLYQRGVSKTDHDKTPHHSDVHVAEGPNAGQTCPQIFTIQGDVLIACIAGPGAPRPTTFSSPPGRGHILSVWLRSSEAAAAPAGPLTARSWLIIAVLVLLASVAGATAQDLAERVGPWAGGLVGGLAGALFFTAVFLLLKWDWRSALSMGLTVAVAANVFEEVRKAVAPDVGPLGAVIVSGSTAIVAAFFVAAVMTRLLKLRT